MKFKCLQCRKTVDLVMNGINLSQKNMKLLTEHFHFHTGQPLDYYGGICKICYDKLEHEKNQTQVEIQNITQELKPSWANISGIENQNKKLKKEIDSHKKKTGRLRYEATKDVNHKTDGRFIL